MDTLHIAPALDAPRLTGWALVASLRTKLPIHELTGVPLRQWAAAVFTAEVEHSQREFWSLQRGVLDIDRHDCPAAYQRCQWPHEAHAARALNALSHMNGAEEDLREHGPAGGPKYCRALRLRWFKSARIFLKSVGDYKAARFKRIPYPDGGL